MRYLTRRGLPWLLSLSFATSCTTVASAAVQGALPDLSIRGEAAPLEPWERDYLLEATERLFGACQRDELEEDAILGTRPNQLTLDLEDGTRRVVQGVGGSSNPFRRLNFYEVSGNEIHKLSDCSQSHILPIASIMEAKGLSPETAARRTRPGLTSYEPNRIGYQYDDNDVGEGYMDAVLSLKYPILHDGYYSEDASFFNPFFAFTGRFSQYIESRESSPVIGRRYNPVLFFRHWLGDDSRYVDLGIGHESNGQNIDSADSYLIERAEFRRQGEDPDFARDYISRGWDYLSLDWKHTWNTRPGGQLDSYVLLKYFLDDGPFQGEPEESNIWEGFGLPKRKEYDGVGFLGKYRFGGDFCAFGDPGRGVCMSKFAWLYTTGYDGVFENNTNRLELTIDFGGLPIQVWGQRGYNSDLVDYFIKTDSWGVTFELDSASLQ